MAARSWERDDDAELTRQREEQQPAASQTAAVDEGPKDTPVKRKRNLLSESHLLSDEGFKKIHRTFPFHVSGAVDGQEVQSRLLYQPSAGIDANLCWACM